MDDIRESFSNLKKGFKQRLRGRKHEPDGAGGDDGEGSTDGRQVRSRNRSPQPGPVPAGGRDDDTQRGDAGVDGREDSQRHSLLDPDVEVGTDSGPGREVEQVYPSAPTPSIPPSGEPDSA